MCVCVWLCLWLCRDHTSDRYARKISPGLKSDVGFVCLHLTFGSQVLAYRSAGMISELAGFYCPGPEIMGTIMRRLLRGLNRSESST